MEFGFAVPKVLAKPLGSGKLLQLLLRRDLHPWAVPRFLRLGLAGAGPARVPNC